MQVNQKKTDLSMSQSFGDRDLKTVEKDLAEKSDLKDRYSEEVSRGTMRSDFIQRRFQVVVDKATNPNLSVCPLNENRSANSINS